jgi:hypothetical protein
MIVLALDVDSTLVTHEYPAMGEDIGAIPWLKQVLEEFPEVRILLSTMRCGADLDLAKVWLEERGIGVGSESASDPASVDRVPQGLRSHPGG